MVDDMKKKVLITGANRGIGRAIMLKMAEKGYDVIAHTRRYSIDFETEVKKIAKKNDVNITPVFFDMTDTDTMKLSIKALFKNKIRIDGLVNCAGMTKNSAFAMLPISDIKEVFDVNFFSQMELTQLILHSMIRNKSGSIVNVASVSGINANKGDSAYGTSKAALISWTKILAKEVAPLGIRVNAVAPGMTDTDMAKLIENREKKISETAMNRLAKPTEIANVVAFLLSEEASFINGEVIRIDGGGDTQ